jgi:hypothetical protein
LFLSREFCSKPLGLIFMRRHFTSTISFLLTLLLILSLPAVAGIITLLDPSPSLPPGAIAVWSPAARRNLLTTDPNAWTKSNVSLTVLAGQGPTINGQAGDALRLTESDVNAQHQLLQSVSLPVGTWIASLYVPKSGSDRYVTLYPQNNGTAYAIFDAASGIVTASGGANHIAHGVISDGLFWRLWLAFNTPSAINENFVVYLSNSSTAQAPIYPGDGSSIFIAAPQLERVPNANLLPNSEDLSGWSNFTDATHTSTSVSFSANAASAIYKYFTPSASTAYNWSAVVSGSVQGQTVRLSWFTSGVGTVYSQDFVVTSTPTRINFPFITGASVGGFSLSISNGSAGAPGTVDVSQAQLTLGSALLPYQRTPITSATPLAWEDTGMGGLVPSRGAVQLGPELVTNGGFDQNANWPKDASWTIAGGVLRGAGSGVAYQNAGSGGVASVVGKLYRVTYTLLNYVSGSVYSDVGSGTSGPSHNAGGTYTDYLIAGSNGATVGLHGVALTGDVDNVSVREVLSYPLMLGGAPNAPTANWPTWESDQNSKGLKMATSQYALTQTIPALNMAGDWSVLVVGKFDGTSGSVVAFSDGVSTNQFVKLAYHGTGKLLIDARNGDSTYSADLAVPATQYIPVILTSRQGVLELRRLDTGVSVNLVNPNPTGATRFGVGVTGSPTPAWIADSLHIAYTTAWPRALNAGEEQRACFAAQLELRNPLSGQDQIDCQNHPFLAGLTPLDKEIRTAFASLRYPWIPDQTPVYANAWVQ